MKRLARVLLVSSVALMPLAGCTTTNPATGSQDFTPFISPEDEKAIGRQEHPKILKEYGGVYDDPKVASYVAIVGGRVSKNSELAQQEFTFTVLDSPIVNAFALPGGYVYITRGLLALANNEAELAAVLGHEVGHVTARHTAKRMSNGQLTQLGSAVLGALLGQGAGQLAQLGSNLYLSSYSRDQEFQADQLGVRYINRVGYDPYAAGTFLDSMGKNSSLEAIMAGQNNAGGGFFATHPNTPERVRRAIDYALKTQKTQGINLLRDRYLGVIDGMTYGDSPAQGLIRGRDFIHPPLRITFHVTPGFTLVNTPTAVFAKGPSESQLKFDMGQSERYRHPHSYLVNEWGKQQRFDKVHESKVDGKDAAVGIFRTRTNGRAVVMVAAAIEGEPKQFYRFQFYAPHEAYNDLQDDFKAIFESFRRISEQEAKEIKPKRLVIVTVRGGETVASLAKRMAFEDYQEERFRVLNALDDHQEVKAGQKVKLITD